MALIQQSKNINNQLNNKTMKKRISFAVVSTLVAISSTAFSQKITQALQANDADVTGTVGIITNWVFGVSALVAFVQAILIFTSSQGTGEEKIKKAGTWIFMVVFLAVAWVVAQALLKK